MQYVENNGYQERAVQCSLQAGLTQDATLKKYWIELADDWIALDNTSIAAKSFV